MLVDSVIVGNTSCYGGNDGTITLYAPLGTGYSLDGINFQPSNVFSNLYSGTYTVTVTDATNCEVIAQVIVSEPTEVEIILGAVPDTICIGQSTTLLANATGGTVSASHVIIWENGVGFGTSVTVSPIETTIYNAFAVDDNGCSSDTASTTIHVLDSIRVQAFSDTVVCGGSEILITASASGGTGSYSFLWNNAMIGSAQNVIPVATTTYSVYATDGCNSPCDSAEITVTVLPDPAASFDVSATVCANEPVVLTMDSAQPPGTECY